MRGGTQVSLEEYLHTTYHPDCDYIDGCVVERNLGEFDHSRTQGLSASLLIRQEELCGTIVLIEQRVQVTPTRYRIADVCVLGPEAPKEQIIRHPPFLCIEIISKDDTMSEIMERVEEYLAMGVPNVWIIDPRLRHGYYVTDDVLREAKDGVLRTSNPDLALPLASLFK